MYTNAFQHTKNKGNLFSEVKVIGPLLAGLPLNWSPLSALSPSFPLSALSPSLPDQVQDQPTTQIDSFYKIITRKFLFYYFIHTL